MNLSTVIGPWGLMLILSLLSAVFALLVFRAASNRAAIKRRHGEMTARLLEILLYRRDFIVCVGGFWRLIRANAAYLLLFAWPIVLCAVPFAVIMSQLSVRLDARPLAAGEQCLLRVVVKPGIDVMDVTVDAPVGGALAMEGMPVRIVESGEIYWSLRSTGDGAVPIAVSAAGATGHKVVACGDGISWAARKVSKAGGLWGWLANPVEPRLDPAGPVESIEIEYPRRVLGAFGMGIEPITAFTVLTLLLGWIMHKPLGVEL